MPVREGPPPINRYLQFMLVGIHEQLQYVVDEATWNRVSDIFRDDRASLSFFSFQEEKTKQVIYVNPRYVVIMQALFDAGWTQAPESDDPDLDRVSFYIAGRPEPLHYDHMDESDIGELNFDLGLLAPDGDDFLTFTDGDGEQNSIRGDKIMLVEVKTTISILKN